jgi:hypothetical protein
VPLQKSFHLVQIRRSRTLLRKRNIHVVVDDNDQPNLRSEVEKPVKRAVLKIRRLSRNLRRHKFFMYRELPDA